MRGKSTLFNALVKGPNPWRPTSCLPRWTPPRGNFIWVKPVAAFPCQTLVGFIRDLPHGLVNAFQATLQEAIDADLLLHVVDASNPQLRCK